MKSAPQISGSPRLRSQFGYILAAALSIMVGIFVVATRNWPLLGDSCLIRYIVFLMQHGFAPYREIVDINMPGAYFVDWAVQHIYGSGHTAWRIFDYTLLAASGVAMIAMAERIDWLAGFIAAALFALLHGADGVFEAGQRDLTVAVLLYAAMALFFRWMRRPQVWPIALAALFTGCAVTIKPTAAVFAGAFAILMLVLPASRPPHVWKHLLACTLAFTSPLIAVFIWLRHEHSISSFIGIFRGLLPFHARLSHRSLIFLLSHSCAPAGIFLLPWLILLFYSKSWRQWQVKALLTAIACGLFCYIVQGKGYPYHRYTLLGFLLLAMVLEFTAASRRSQLDRVLGVASLIGLVFVLAPIQTYKAQRYEWRNQEFISMLSSDMESQGGPRLSGQIQCLDTTSGCIRALYRMRLIQATGFLYDCYLFAPGQTPATERLRDKFLNVFEQARPLIVVETDQFCLGGARNFNKAANWPQFDQYFRQNYTLRVERRPSRIVKLASRSEWPSEYRIYKRNAVDAPTQDQSSIR